MEWFMENWSIITTVIGIITAIVMKVQKDGWLKTALWLGKGIEVGDGKHGPVKTLLKNSAAKALPRIARNVAKIVDAVDVKKDTPRPLLNALLKLRRR